MSANEKQIGGAHYKTEYEHWDLAIKIPLGYLEGCATKYVARWRHKHGLEDLRKAHHYLEKLIETTSYNPMRFLTPSQIKNEVSKFVLINRLDIWEQTFILALCTYNQESDLTHARKILDDIIRDADEPNYPGTPADGGHHSRF